MKRCQWGMVGIMAAFVVSFPIAAASPQDHAAHHPRTAAVSNTVMPLVFTGVGGVTLTNSIVAMGVNASTAKSVANLVEQVRAYAREASARDAKRATGNALSQIEADVAWAAFMHAELVARWNIIATLGPDLGLRVNGALFGPDMRAGSMGNLGAMVQGGAMAPIGAVGDGAKGVTDLDGLDVSVPETKASDTMYDQMMKMMNMMQPHMKDMMGGSATETPKRTDLDLPDPMTGPGGGS